MFKRGSGIVMVNSIVLKDFAMVQPGQAVYHWMDCCDSLDFLKPSMMVMR